MKSPAGLLLFLRTIAAAALLAELGGLGRVWLPPPAATFAVLVGLYLLEPIWAACRRPDETQRPQWWTVIRPQWFPSALVMLVAIGTVIRLPSLGSDLGHVPLDIDEHRLAASVQHFFRTGEVDHSTVEHYPGIVFWLLAGSSLITYVRALMDGTISSIDQMPVELFVLTGRITNVVLTAGLIVFTGLLGRQLSGPAAGLMGAAIVAIAPLSLDTTTLLRNETGQVLLIVAAVWATMELLRSDRHTWAMAAGGLAGLATGVKYSGVFTLLAVFAAAAARGSAAAKLRKVGVAVCGFAITLGGSNHFLWADFSNFVKQLSTEVSMTGPGHWAAMENPPWFYTSTLADHGVGWPMLLLAAASGAYGLAAATGRRETWVVWIAPLSYVWFMTKQPSQFPRWVFPVLPFVAAAGAGALVELTRAVRGWQSRRHHRPVVIQATAGFLVVLTLGPPLWRGAIDSSRRIGRPTHEVAEMWIEQHAARGYAMLAENGVLKLTRSDLRVQRVPDLADALAAKRYDIYAQNWIIVSEPQFGIPALQNFEQVARFDADRRFGGNVGLDFAVYAPPKLPRASEGANVWLDDPSSAPFIGPEWIANDSGRPGMVVPADGATLFLPPLVAPAINIELELIRAGDPSDRIPLAVEAFGQRIPLGDAPAQTTGTRVLLGQIIPPGEGSDVITLRLRPLSANRIRLLRFRFG